MAIVELRPPGYASRRIPLRRRGRRVGTRAYRIGAVIGGRLMSKQPRRPGRCSGREKLAAIGSHGGNPSQSGCGGTVCAGGIRFLSGGNGADLITPRLSARNAPAFRPRSGACNCARSNNRLAGACCAVNTQNGRTSVAAALDASHPRPLRRCFAGRRQRSERVVRPIVTEPTQIGWVPSASPRTCCWCARAAARETPRFRAPHWRRTRTYRARRASLAWYRRMTRRCPTAWLML
jgi:hypothetical protein